MVKREKIYLPMGAGGLLRYPEEEKEVIKIKPEHVVYIVIAIILFEIILRIFPLVG
jgi:preprotein translocase subunit Sec61beta